jgi:hypothetical protein
MSSAAEIFPVRPAFSARFLDFAGNHNRRNLQIGLEFAPFIFDAKKRGETVMEFKHAYG